jgi:dipeptidyl aminopeptidase/acylaminoacyl peptidase
VIDRFQFKEDETGYLTTRHSHLYLLDRESHKAQTLTSGRFDELLPAWSPDGKAIAFVSKRGPDPDRTENWDVYSIEPRAGAPASQLTTFEGPDEKPDWETRPAWSPDGKWVAYLQGGEARLIEYAVHRLAVVSAAGGSPRLLTAELDRNVTSPRFSRDGSTIYFLLEDDRAIHLARLPFAGGPIERVVAGRRTVSSFSVSPADKVAVLVSTAIEPDEVFVLERGEPRRISHQNDSWLAEVSLGAVEETSFVSKDGTEIHGFLLKPPGYREGERVPTVLRIHGGPVWQYYNDFRYKLEWQWLAANGYAVVAANPRGSSGRGERFALGIWADWGHRDAEDVLAAVDDAVRRGVTDSDRLGVGGWSYGGLLTNYVIAQDTRFKAATSGAGASNILAGYGTDEYIRDYESELGPPWKNAERWIGLSFPFLHADRIRTPTLFLCGEDDFNVPLLNSEQMYEALRSLDIPTQLVIYPGQSHALRRPSFVRDRLERYLSWYDKYVKAARVEKAAASH